MNEEQQEIGNLRAAMDKVAETLEPTISPGPNNDDGPADKQVLIRTNDAERDRWKDAAAKDQLSLSAWIRKSLNQSASDVLDCPHPMEMIRFYPWAGGKKVCTRCRQRL